MRGCCGPARSWASSSSTARPGRPEGRGKIERFFRTVRGQFLAELTEARAAQVAGLEELNRLFTAWMETVYHVRVHSETGQPPLARWEAGGPFPSPSLPDLAEAFRWSEWRTVSKTATVSMHGNRYQVDPGLSGQRVELVFDPLSLPCDKGSYADLGIIPMFTCSGRRRLPEVGIMQASRLVVFRCGEAVEEVENGVAGLVASQLLFGHCGAVKCPFLELQVLPVTEDSDEGGAGDADVGVRESPAVVVCGGALWGWCRWLWVRCRGYVSVTSVMAARAACSSTMALLLA